LETTSGRELNAWVQPVLWRCSPRGCCTTPEDPSPLVSTFALVMVDGGVSLISGLPVSPTVRLDRPLCGWPQPLDAVWFSFRVGLCFSVATCGPAPLRPIAPHCGPQALALGSKAITSLCVQMEDWAAQVGLAGGKGRGGRRRELGSRRGQEGHLGAGQGWIRCCV
jgi:hypothetical protein